jgi:hypothetical protein
MTDRSVSNYQTISMDGNSSKQRWTVERSSLDQRRTDPIDDPTPNHQAPATSSQSFTARSLLVGLIIGALVTFSNTYFGLQTGWISTMAMPSALIGFSVFKVLSQIPVFPLHARRECLDTNGCWCSGNHAPWMWICWRHSCFGVSAEAW